MTGHDPHASNLCISAQPRRQSLFVGLPTEIHQYIYSFLPVSLQSLVNLAATCRRLREICTPLIYFDPFPSPAFIHETRSAALVKVLSSKPHLASHIRRLSVRVEGTSVIDDIEIPFNYPPLQLCLGDSITNLVELRLYVPYACADCTVKWSHSLEVACHFRMIDAIAAIARRWPNLSSLSLRQLGACLRHPDEAAGIPSPTQSLAASVPHHLENLVILDDVYGSTHVSWATQKALMNASSQTLRHLVLYHQQRTIHDLLAFPSLERLEFATDLPTIEDICLLLQKSFSSVRFLSLGYAFDLADSPGITLDLSGIFDDLEHLSIAASLMSRLILPPSVVTVAVTYSGTGYPSITATGSPHLAALSLDGRSHTVFDVFAAPSEERSSAFQTVHSLELRVRVRVEDLPRLGEIIAARLPKLEVLILKVRAFSMRRRGKDNPMDNSLDDVQKAAAVSFFESCPGLNTISFNGIPDVWDPIGYYPARVWTRYSEDAGAHMTGRAALPWKVSEMWDYY